MCEIAVIPVDDATSDDEERLRSLVSLAEMFYDENPHGLGVVSTERNDDDTFSHNAFKTGWTDSGMSSTALYEHLTEVIDDAWRLTVHARFATAGDVDKTGTHPIITAAEAGPAWDAVVHNGSIRGHKARRSRLRRKDDHTFASEVDSEVIAHVTDKPEDVDHFLDESDDGWEEPSLRGNLNYLLFADDYILAFTEGKYHIGDNFSMACDHRDYNTDVESQGDEGWFLVTPDGEVNFREYTPSYTGRKTTVVGGSGNKWWSGSSHFGGRSAYAASGSSASDETDDADSDADDDASVPATRETSIGSAYTAGLSTLLEQNPHISDEEAFDYHEGYFVGADSFVCKEHGKSFMRVCPACLQEDIEIARVGLTHIPDIYGDEITGTAEVRVEENANVKVTRCPNESEWFVRRDCPFCGVPHNEDEEQERLERNYA